SFRAAAMRNTSSFSAKRLGTGLPQAPECVGDFEVANPMAPASMASRTMSCMRATSASVAARSVASSPSTYRRNGVCPIMAPTLSRFGVASSASRYCGNVSNVHGMPASSASTDAIPSRPTPSAPGALLLGELAELAVEVRVRLDVHGRKQAIEPSRQPPVAVAEQLHGGGHEHEANDRGVDEHRDREAHAEE